MNYYKAHNSDLTSSYIRGYDGFYFKNKDYTYCQYEFESTAPNIIKISEEEYLKAKKEISLMSKINLLFIKLINFVKIPNIIKSMNKKLRVY